MNMLANINIPYTIKTDNFVESNTAQQKEKKKIKKIGHDNKILLSID